ncbi:MAG: hypothetical protein TREMPRED_001005 [Tremellales sp. Tagirdzhanova-0007]|nr:MAG: hypothetical protein TREMPRED_001005 [Tremellales sp. Tagirdzhanova-0007]
MTSSTKDLIPHREHRSLGIRKIYIQKLTDLLHICLLRNETERARRAWGILIRCREVDWKSRWYWGLELLSAVSRGDETQTTVLPSTSRSQPDDVERWLKGLRIKAREEDRPSLLHAFVLHQIKQKNFRAALEELETYLPSYPYLLSGSLHTYAGMLAFYLAQPMSARVPMTSTEQLGRDTTESVPSEASRSLSPSQSSREPPNANLMRQARGWFAKAQEIDPNDEVAEEFIRIIEDPGPMGDESGDDRLEDDERDDDESMQDDHVEQDWRNDEKSDVAELTESDAFDDSEKDEAEDQSERDLEGGVGEDEFGDP